MNDRLIEQFHTALEGKTVGEMMLEDLEGFSKQIQKGKETVPAVYTCHNVTLNLRPQEYTAELVKRTREVLHASQAVFAAFIGVARSTVRSWEQGINVPKDSACRLMDEIRADPDYWRKRMLSLAQPKTGAKNPS